MLTTITELLGLSVIINIVLFLTVFKNRTKYSSIDDLVLSLDYSEQINLLIAYEMANDNMLSRKDAFAKAIAKHNTDRVKFAMY